MSTGQGLHSLATIIKRSAVYSPRVKLNKYRLEAATSRLEDLAQASGVPVVNAKDTAGSDVASPSSYTAPRPPPPAVEDPQMIISFDQNVIDGKLKPFLELTKSFAGPSVIESVCAYVQLRSVLIHFLKATLVQKQFTDLRTLLVIVGHSSKPDQKTLETLVAPFEPTMQLIARLKEDNRKDRDWYNHLAVLADGAPSLGWVINVSFCWLLPSYSVQFSLRPAPSSAK